MEKGSSLRDILGQISQTKIWGVIPLDIILHSLVGIAVTLVILKKKKKGHFLALIIVSLLAILKEIYDSGTMTATLLEAIKDILVTILFPLLLIGVSYFKKKIDRETIL